MMDIVIFTLYAFTLMFGVLAFQFGGLYMVGLAFSFLLSSGLNALSLQRETGSLL